MMIILTGKFLNGVQKYESFAYSFTNRSQLGGIYLVPLEICRLNENADACRKLTHSVASTNRCMFTPLTVVLFQ